MTKYVIGPDVALRLAKSQAEIRDEHQILAPTLVRSQILSLLYQAVRRGEMNTQQLSQSNGDQCARVRERLVLELQRSLDNFDRQYGSISISKLVFAMTTQVDGLAASLAENIYVPVQEMDLASVMDFPAVPELRDTRCQARNFLAIGAALRTLRADEVAK